MTQDEKQHGNMVFEDALQAMKLEKRCARSGWNGKNMWVSVVYSGHSSVHNKHIDSLVVNHFLVIKDALGHIVPWLPSQDDLFAWDWFEVDA